MLKQFNYLNGFAKKESNIDSKIQKLYQINKEKITEKQKELSSKFDTESNDLDMFFTLLLKNLTSKERYLLLSKLLNIDWDSPDETLESYLQELINKRKDNDEELKKTLNYEYFLWDFNNWKNFFLSDQEK